MGLFITELFSNPAFYCAMVAAFMASICIHEFSHATMAHWLGDDTAKRGGFQTVNPLKVMGWPSIACLLLFGFSWGAVPVRPGDPDRRRRSLVSLAGPASNFLLMWTASLSLRTLFPLPDLAEGGAEFARMFLSLVVHANAILLLFNLLPIPMLDGWEAVEPFLPAALVPSPAAKGAMSRVAVLLFFTGAASGLFERGTDWITDRFIPGKRAMVHLSAGDKCADSGNWEGAFAEFAQAAELGSPAGKYVVANLLLDGRGCARDIPRAVRLLEDPVVLRHFPGARVTLGILAVKGIGIPQDFAKARELLDGDDVLRDSAEARGVLGRLLLKGQGGAPDSERGFALLSDPEVFADVPGSRFLAGMCHYRGEGTAQDFAEAARQLRIAAEEGDRDARAFLGWNGNGLPDYGMPLEDALRRFREEHGDDP